MTAPLLATRNLEAFYGDFQALFGVDLELNAGEIVSVIGANGAGKSTLLNSIMGLIRVKPDMVVLEGRQIGGALPYRMVSAGVAIVPEGRRLFNGMTVEENLRVAIDHGAQGTNNVWGLDLVYELFPVIHDKKRDLVQHLSGGQQQMVSIARALLNQPRILLCDEISLGLAPKVISEIYSRIPSIAGTGTAIILVEQDVGLAQEASDRLYCLLEGRFTLSGRSADLARSEIARAYFGTHDELG